ncbi:hypothetical protein KI387_033870 [Taxus chinensis]|uniref:Uncharacterized protein n=2 Tax=Taxus chinensis TaxID=29808 RepID=A0AA38BYW4_TAXCH|nr:hypothetical protein KI387_033870 [Taxus chinensis]
MRSSAEKSSRRPKAKWDIWDRSTRWARKSDPADRGKQLTNCRERQSGTCGTKIPEPAEPGEKGPDSPKHKRDKQTFISEEGVVNARGRVLGGSSKINAGFYSRAGLGYVREAGWDEALVNRSYSWVERAVVSRPVLKQWQGAFRNGLCEGGVKPDNGFTLDHVEGTKIGGSTFDQFGRRHSSADLLQYANKDNLKVGLHATVHRILFHHPKQVQYRLQSSRRRAYGVEYTDAYGIIHRATLSTSKGEVIISSGQGMADNPRNGISLLSPLPLEYSLIQVVGITKTYFIEASSTPVRIPFGRYVYLGNIMEKVVGPLSKGELYLRTGDIKDNPSVRFNYFSHPQDVINCVEGLRTIDSALRTGYLKVFALTFIHPRLPADTNNFTAMEEFCRKTVATIWHYHGGCLVGSVVNKKYQVQGLDSLRVIDGSTFNKSPGTNPQATVMMLGRLSMADVVPNAAKESCMAEKNLDQGKIYGSVSSGVAADQDQNIISCEPEILLEASVGINEMEGKHTFSREATLKVTKAFQRQQSKVTEIMEVCKGGEDGLRRDDNILDSIIDTNPENDENCELVSKSSITPEILPAEKKLVVDKTGEPDFEQATTEQKTKEEGTASPHAETSSKTLHGQNYDQEYNIQFPESNEDRCLSGSSIDEGCAAEKETTAIWKNSIKEHATSGNSGGYPDCEQHKLSDLTMLADFNGRSATSDVAYMENQDHVQQIVYGYAAQKTLGENFTHRNIQAVNRKYYEEYASSQPPESDFWMASSELKVTEYLTNQLSAVMSLIPSGHFVSLSIMVIFIVYLGGREILQADKSVAIGIHVFYHLTEIFFRHIVPQAPQQATKLGDGYFPVTVGVEFIEDD